MRNKTKYQPDFCDELLAFFNGAAFTVTEVQKRDGSVSLLETACELPTFAAFAKKINVTCAQLREWENKYPAFKYACEQARDRQKNILIQNSLRGNYASSFAVFTAKNLLGWKDGKEEAEPMGPVTIEWGDEDEKE